MIALVRTSGEPADRHAGLSQFIVDLRCPGVTVRPIGDLAGDAHFNEVFFDGVELAEDALIGAEGRAGPGHRRAGVRAQRARADLLQHRAAGHVDRLPARDGRRPRMRRPSAGWRRTSRPAQHVRRLTTRLVQARARWSRRRWSRIMGTEFEQDVPPLVAAAIAADPGAVRRCRLARAAALPRPGGAHLFAARRHARDPARHDRARPRTPLRNPHVCRSHRRYPARPVHAAVVRAIEAGGSPQSLWDSLAGAGFLDLLAPEEAGGAPCRLPEFFPVLTHFGRYAVPVPVAQAIAARALVGADVLCRRPATLAPALSGYPMAPSWRRWCRSARSPQYVLAAEGDRLLFLARQASATHRHRAQPDRLIDLARAGSAERLAGNAQASHPWRPRCTPHCSPAR